MWWLFRIVENKYVDDSTKEFKSKIVDWGLSHTTLEEVFMKVNYIRLKYIYLIFMIKVTHKKPQYEE